MRFKIVTFHTSQKKDRVCFASGLNETSDLKEGPLKERSR